MLYQLPLAFGEINFYDSTVNCVSGKCHHHDVNDYCYIHHVGVRTETICLNIVKMEKWFLIPGCFLVSSSVIAFSVYLIKSGSVHCDRLIHCSNLKNLRARGKTKF